jgi:hypothetical protein
MIYRAALNQTASKMAIDIVISAVYDRITLKYGRGESLCSPEAGHAAQNNACKPQLLIWGP